MKTEDMWRLETAESMLVRVMCGVTPKNRIALDELRNCLNIRVESVKDLSRGTLKWLGHVERISDDD